MKFIVVFVADRFLFPRGIMLTCICTSLGQMMKVVSFYILASTCGSSTACLATKLGSMLPTHPISWTPGESMPSFRNTKHIEGACSYFANSPPPPA